jgi:hypothetical protein
MIMKGRVEQEAVMQREGGPQSLLQDRSVVLRFVVPELEALATVLQIALESS